MFRILGQIEVYGSKSDIDLCASIALIEGGVIKQIGLKRKIPDTDSWYYASPLYCFNRNRIDEEIHNFIASCSRIGEGISASGIKEAFFTLYPIDQSFDEMLSCVFSNETITLISSLGIGLQIAPEVTMPDAPYWVLR
ncbi:MAG: hypothetical protein WCL60_15035 [Methylococcales bacterium]